MKFLGDIHGNWKFYNHFTNNNENSIQVGDFGAGFERWISSPLDTDAMIRNNHQMIRGNHDNPRKIAEYPGYISDGLYDRSGNAFCVGGALSIDAGRRTVGLDWWEDEECDYSKFTQILNTYDENRPDLMVTHDCPLSIYKHLATYSPEFKSITSTAFDHFLTIHKPKIWIFGHHHLDFDAEIDGTRFICANINSVVEI